MPARLGDDVDDYCIKCKRITNHVVVSLMEDGPAKVRCRTCHSDHDYRHELAPPPKVDPRKLALQLEKQAAAERANSLSAAAKESAGDAETVLDVAEPVDGESQALAATAGKSAVKTLKARKAQG